MSTVEDRLGEAMRARAGQRTASELPDAMQRVRHRIRRQRRRQAVGGTAAVVVVSAAAMLVVPVTDLVKGPNQKAGPAAGPAAVEAPSPAAGSGSQIADAARSPESNYAEFLRQQPPMGKVSMFKSIPDMPEIKTYVWLEKPNRQTEFSMCWYFVNVERAGGGCANYSGPPREIRPARQLGAQGPIEGRGEAHVGVANGTVASVTGVVDGGAEIPGSLLALPRTDYPTWRQAWQVGSLRPVHSVVFRDRSGKVIKTLNVKL